MANMNKFFIDGNVVRNFELRKTSKGASVVTYTVAVDHIFYVDGVKTEKTDYIPVTRYGRDAENDHKYLRRGSGVTVMGALRSWWNPDTKKGGFIFEAHEVKYQGGGNDAGGTESPPAPEAGQGDDWLRDYEEAERVMGRQG